MRKIAQTAVASLAIALAASALTALPAQAADAFSVTLSNSTDLVRAGDNITATLANVPADEGVYVEFCAAPAIAGSRPSACFGQGAWATPNSAMWNYGAVDIAAPVAVAVQQSFAATDSSTVNCGDVVCGVFVRRDHLNGADTSLDTFVPVSFAPVYSVTLSKSTDLVRANDSIDVTVAGLTGTQGVYVRLCEAPSVVGSRPENCFGQGDWLSHDPVMLNYGASTAAVAQPLAVQSSFAAGDATIDCTVVSCGVFVRLDHTDPTNTSLDLFTPVTFAAAPIVTLPAPAVASVMKHKNHLIFSLVGNKGDKVVIMIGNRRVNGTFKSANASYTFAAPKGKSVKVTVKVAGKTQLNKKVKLG